MHRFYRCYLQNVAEVFSSAFQLRSLKQNHLISESFSISQVFIHKAEKVNKPHDFIAFLGAPIPSSYPLSPFSHSSTTHLRRMLPSSGPYSSSYQPYSSSLGSPSSQDRSRAQQGLSSPQAGHISLAASGNASGYSSWGVHAGPNPSAGSAGMNESGRSQYQPGYLLVGGFFKFTYLSHAHTHHSHCRKTR